MSWIAKLVFWTADVVVLVVVAFHIYFMVLEMFLWTTPHGRKKFRLYAGRGAVHCRARRQSGAV